MFGTYDFELIGQTALIIHADRVDAADDLEAWRKSPENKKSSKPGDDRSPPWSWMTYVYPGPCGYMVMPSENIMSALRKAGSTLTLKGKTTFKALSQSGLVILDEHCELLGPAGRVPLAALDKIRGLEFSRQAEQVKSLGFGLFVKRAPIGKSKHIRVRPRFESWTVRGTIEVLDAAITPDILRQLFEMAGKYAGLGDWRPSAKESPGPYGRFVTKIAAA